jgi:hypothetical protein
MKARLLSALLVPASIAVASASGSTGGQRVHRPTWLTPAGFAADVRVTERERGSCLSVSLTVARRDAWRCDTDDFIIDPCFSAGSKSRILACPVAPWSRRVVALRLRSPLKRWRPFLDATRHAPWAIRVSNGKRCRSLFGAALDSVNGKPVTYRCAGSGFLLGWVGAVSSTVEYLALKRLPSGDPHSKRVKRLRITDVWR